MAWLSGMEVLLRSVGWPMAGSSPNSLKMALKDAGEMDRFGTP
jgi:hypothetical protein